jgi:hypothetical protein
MMIYESGAVARMAHFAAAFFAHRLQDREDLAFYYSREFVAGHADLAWGIDGNSRKQLRAGRVINSCRRGSGIAGSGGEKSPASENPHFRGNVP